MEQDWESLRAELEKLMEKLPQMEAKGRLLSRSELAHGIVHHKSLMESAWEMAGILEQKLLVAKSGDPNIPRFRAALEKQRLSYGKEKRAMEEKMAAGGFSDMEEVLGARLSVGERKGLELELLRFQSQYTAALERCKASDAAMESRPQ